MRDENALHRRAREAGVVREWTDAAGVRRRASDDTLAAVLEALGPAAEQKDVPLITAEAGHPVRLPSGRMQAFEAPGYHRSEGITVAVAPPRGWTIADAAPGRRVWGAAVQVPSLRDHRGQAFGDFTALAACAETLGRAGADALAISPVHALFPADPSRFGPYGPSSRLFLNVWLVDAEEGADRAARLIDWQRAAPRRMARLRQRFDERRDDERAAAHGFASDGLERHAIFDALSAHFGGGWPLWPAACRDPDSATVAAFASERREEVEFYRWLQWRADRGLAAAQERARKAGMAVGLIADLAVGMAADGSHAWGRSDALLRGLTVGAPPDPFAPDGQDWEITTFSPAALRRTGFADFLATIRTALRHAGGVRIDHAMGLSRLWVVPHGFPATAGAYLLYPERDLMRLLALESWLAKAVVVGEDLGTVPSGFRERLAARGFLGMRVLWFERDQPPAAWDRQAAAMTSTHDLPTIAGWWSERDIDWRWRIGGTGAFTSQAEERAARAKERRRLWRTIGSGPQPPKGHPQPAVTAAISHVAASACALALVPAEDLLGVAEQPHLPGATDGHPNWRHRLPLPVETMLDRPEIAGRVAKLNEARGR